MTPRDRDALLSAYRAERGPSRAQAEKLWVRLSEDVADPSSEGRVAGPVSQRGRAVAIAAFVLAAAIFFGVAGVRLRRGSTEFIS